MLLLLGVDYDIVLQAVIVAVTVLSEEFIGVEGIVTIPIAVPVFAGIGADEHIIIDKVCSHIVKTDDGVIMVRTQQGRTRDRSSLQEIFPEELDIGFIGVIVALEVRTQLSARSRG